MIRAKFYVSNKEQVANFPGNLVQRGKVTMRPVYSNDPKAENKAFWDATPNGEITLWISNAPAYDDLEIGAEYYVDFTKAEPAP